MVAFSKHMLGVLLDNLILSTAATIYRALALSQVPYRALPIKLLNRLKLVVTGIGWLTS